MVLQPTAYLLDEPFSDLDANLRDRMQTEVKKLQREVNKAMIFVTHDQQEALSLGDKIGVMNKGNLQQIGTPYEIYNEPANLFVAKFIGSPSTNIIESRLVENEGSVTISGDFFEYTLSNDIADEFRADVHEVTGKVLLGIRPEHLQLGVDDPVFESNIDVVEPQGPNDIVNLTVDGIELRALTAQGKVKNEDTSIGVGIREERLWLFRPDGTRIL